MFCMRHAALLPSLAILDACLLHCDGPVEGLPDACVGCEAQSPAPTHSLAACPVDVSHAEHLGMCTHLTHCVVNI